MSDQAEKLFKQSCIFAAAAETLDRVPHPTLPEIAFVGRSNVGKSSFINALVGQKKLARSSNTPGRTQQINFFNLADTLFLVDLPGYGYAKASKTKIEAWTDVMEVYLTQRPTLKMVCVLVDGRHGVKDSDDQMLGMLAHFKVPHCIILTKTDKNNKTENETVLSSVKERVSAPVFPVSSEKKWGLEMVQGFLAGL